jgi:hypothetical protein
MAKITIQLGTSTLSMMGLFLTLRQIRRIDHQYAECGMFYCYAESHYPEYRSASNKPYQSNITEKHFYCDIVAWSSSVKMKSRRYKSLNERFCFVCLK